MSIERLHKLLSSDENCVRINRDLLKVLDVEEAILYSMLVSEYQEKLNHDDYKFFDDKKYIYCPVEDVERVINLSAFRQRNVLNKLEKKNLLNVKLGQARSRYIWINDDAAVLETLIYGLPINDYEKKFIEMFLEQLNQFKEQNNINVETSYLFDYGTPWQKIISNDMKLKNSHISWITQSNEDIKPIIDIKYNKIKV